METSLPSFDRRALRRASVAVASVALLAACSNDNPVEPTAARIPTSVQPTVQPNGLGTIRLSTVTTEANVKKLIGGAKFSIQGPRTSKTVSDNDANDMDPTWGKIKLMNLLPGTWNVCETVPPVGYVVFQLTCQQLTVNANGTTTAEFNHLVVAHAQFEVRNAANQLVGGATFTIRDATNTPIIVVKDNDAKDIALTAGFFTVRLPAAGSYWVCPTTAPAGYVFESMTCYYRFYQNGYYSSAGTFKLKLAAVQP